MKIKNIRRATAALRAIVFLSECMILFLPGDGVSPAGLITLAFAAVCDLCRTLLLQGCLKKPKDPEGMFLSLPLMSLCARYVFLQAALCAVFGLWHFSAKTAFFANAALAAFMRVMMILSLLARAGIEASGGKGAGNHTKI